MVTPKLSFFWKAKALTKSWQTSRPAWALYLVNQWPTCPSQGPMRLRYFVYPVTKAITYCRPEATNGGISQLTSRYPEGWRKQEETQTVSHVFAKCLLNFVNETAQVKSKTEPCPAWSFIAATLLSCKERGLQWEHRPDAASALAFHQLLAEEWAAAWCSLQKEY